jgi:hypothetical protein
MSSVRNRARFARVIAAAGQNPKVVKPMAEPNQSVAEPQTCGEHVRGVGRFANIALTAAKPLLQYQASMLRLWAGNCELIARNLEQDLEAISSASDQQSRE